MSVAKRVKNVGCKEGNKMSVVKRVTKCRFRCNEDNYLNLSLSSIIMISTVS